MGKADTAARAYTRQNDIFADAFNFFVYHGKQIIQPERPHELDAAELAMLYAAGSAGFPVQKYRYVLKKAAVMEDGKAAYLLLGIENQKSVHYAAPVRNFLYDALQYARQIEQIADGHRKKRDYHHRKAGEFLSGFYLGDKLFPVITLIILFSPEIWDGPRSLHEMMSTKDPELLSLVPDYRIHLVSPREIPQEEFHKFRSSLGDVLSFIKYSKDKEQMNLWLNGPGMQVKFGRKEVDVLNSCVGTKLHMEEAEEEVKVCEAFRLLIEEAAEKAAAEAAEKAAAEAAEKAVKEAEEKAERMRLLSVKNLMKNLHVTAEQAIAALEISDSDGKRILQKL